MISNSTSAYIFIRLTIVALRLIAPLSIVYCLLKIFIPRLAALPLGVEIIVYAETAFYFFVYLPRRHVLQQPASEGPTMSKSERMALFDKCLETTPDMRRYLNVWFKGAAVEDLKRDDIKEWLAWAFFNQGECKDCDQDEIEDYVLKIERRLDYEFAAGHGSHRGMRPTIDPITIQHRSLLYYLFAVGGADAVCYIRMRLLSFQHYHHGLFTSFPVRFWSIFSSLQSPATTIPYWYRPHTSKTRLPVLFIHGIGIGLHTYVDFFKDLIHEDHQDLGEDGEIGILALEIMPISFRITHLPLSRDEMVGQILQILDTHQWEKFVLVSHSYGTIISRHLLENPKARSRIGPVVLIDPVSITLHSGDVAYNFAYRSPRKASEYQLHYFACTDMAVAHTITRRFMWTENVLFKEDIEDRRVTVMLAGEDIIANTQAIGQYLSSGEDVNAWKHQEWTGHGLDILWYEDLNHAQVFDTEKDRKAVIKATLAYCQGVGVLVAV